MDQKDVEYYANLESVILWPKPYQIDDFDEFRNELLRLVYTRRDERKQDERRQLQANEFWLEFNRKHLERTVRKQEEDIMWRGHHSEKE